MNNGQQWQKNIQLITLGVFFISNSGLLWIKISSSLASLRGESSIESGDNFIAKSTTKMKQKLGILRNILF